MRNLDDNYFISIFALVHEIRIMVAYLLRTTLELLNSLRRKIIQVSMKLPLMLMGVLTPRSAHARQGVLLCNQIAYHYNLLQPES